MTPQAAAPMLVQGRVLIEQCLVSLLDEHDQLIILGEDVDSGGTWGQLLGPASHAPRRVRSLRGDGAGRIDLALGLASSGRPVLLHLPDADLAAQGLAVLASAVAGARYLGGPEGSAGQGSLTIRVTRNAASRPGHVPSLESWLSAIPGLRVVAAGDPTGLCGLLRGAVDSPDPVVIIEPEEVYAAELPVSALLVPPAWPVERAARLREGTDLTLVSWGAALAPARGAAAMCAASGFSVELLDLRCLAPLDRSSLRASVATTGRLVIAAAGPVAGGVAAEIAADCATWSLLSLEAPVVRVGGLDLPRQREHRGDVPDASTIHAACLQVAGF